MLYRKKLQEESFDRYEIQPKTYRAVHPFRMMPLASVRFRTAGLQSYSMKCADIFLTLVFGSIAPQTPIIYNIEPDVIIEADSVRLAQVLINLLSNSIKYTQAGGASLSLKREGRNVVIEITDSGEGMDEETAKNIINRSSQAFKAVNSKGVGLYIAKLIVDKHGWALDIESHKGRGTTVRIIM